MRSGSSKAKPGRNAETERATTAEKAAKEAVAADDGDSCDPSTARRSALVPSSKKAVKKPDNGGQWQWMAQTEKLPELLPEQLAELKRMGLTPTSEGTLRLESPSGTPWQDKRTIKKRLQLIEKKAAKTEAEDGKPVTKALRLK